MAVRALFATIVLLASVRFATLNDVFKCAPILWKKLDIRKFVGTREPIWTWNTTAKEDISCKVDKMKSLAEGSILFTRKFHTSSELRPIAENYEGIFLKKQRNVMQLREPGHNFMAKETILYHSERYHCAVIKVTPTLRGHLPYYDLRVWNSVVRQGPQKKCIIQFMKHGPSGHVIYQSTCQGILPYKGR